MGALPDAVTLAGLVSNVTETVCGATFAPADGIVRGESILGRMVMLPIPGARDIRIVLSCDGAGGRALGSVLRNCPREQLTRAMIDDAIAELLNMVAGQIQRALEIDQPLGLPRPTSLAELSEAGGVGFEDAILLSSPALADIKLWIFEIHPLHQAVAVPKAKAGMFRSLFRKA